MQMLIYCFTLIFGQTVSLWPYYYGILGFATYPVVNVTFSSCSISSFNHSKTPQNACVLIDFCSSNLALKLYENFDVLYQGMK